MHRYDWFKELYVAKLTLNLSLDANFNKVSLKKVKVCAFCKIKRALSYRYSSFYRENSGVNLSRYAWICGDHVFRSCLIFRVNTGWTTTRLRAENN